MTILLPDSHIFDALSAASSDPASPSTASNSAGTRLAIDLSSGGDIAGFPGVLGTASTGTGDTPLVNARTDSEIAAVYLHHAELAATTRKSTRTELGRFLLWCKANGLALAAMSVENLTAYKQFLRDPQPAHMWISATRWPRADPRWRPFSGPLSDASARQAFRVAKSLLGFATDAGYLRRNAGALVRNIKPARRSRIERYLGDEALGHVFAALETMPDETPSRHRRRLRERFLLLCFVSTGARLSEISQAAMGAIYTEGDGRWWLEVVGKGAKPRRLPVVPALLAAWQAYRSGFGLPAVAARAEPVPLVLSIRPGMPAGAERTSAHAGKWSGIGDEAIGKAIRQLFAAASDLALKAGHVDSATVLRQASTHWLRHTMLTRQANRNVALKTLQETAGHASLSTTAMYLHKSDHERHDELLNAMEKAGAWPGK